MITDRIQDDLKTAMKARESDRVSVLRMVMSELKNARIDKGDDLDDDGVIQVLKRCVKQREESATQYREADRADLAEKEAEEAAIIGAYLPAMLSGDALEAAVKAAIEATGATSMKDMGKVMKAVLSEHGALVDGKSVQGLVKQLLG